MINFSKDIFKFLLIFLCILFSNQSFSQDGKINVTVSGVGSNYDEALKNALTNATSEAYGILILTERRIKDEKLEQDDISYSQGVIEGYKLLNKYYDSKSQAFVVEISAQVSKSFIEKKLMGVYDSSNVSGSEISNAIRKGIIQNNSEANRHNQARNLFLFHSRDFPENLYEISNGTIQVNRNEGKISLSMQVHISYNRNAINDLCTVVTAYQNTRLSSIDDALKNITGLLYINNGNKTLFNDGCSSLAFIDKDLYTSLINKAFSTGICLKLYDNSNQEITKIFYKFSSANYEEYSVDINLSPGLGKTTIYTPSIPDANHSILLSKKYLADTLSKLKDSPQMQGLPTAMLLANRNLPISTLIIEYKKFNKPEMKTLSFPNLSIQQIESISRTYSQISNLERCK